MQNRLRYPVVQDNDYGTWNAFGNKSWPGDYLIDAKGRVRYAHAGEGDDAQTEAAVRSLLREAGATGVAGRAPAPAPVEQAAIGESTPETYLGLNRAAGFSQRPHRGLHTYHAPSQLEASQFALGGRWKIGAESALAVYGASISPRIQARKLFLVLASKGNIPRKVQVLVDGQPITDDIAGEDVHGGVATIRTQRLYRLVDFGSVQDRRVQLRFADGIRGFAFTFG